MLANTPTLECVLATNCARQLFVIRCSSLSSGVLGTLRLHLFEFEDLSWFPAVIRDLGTDWLAFFSTRLGVSAGFASIGFAHRVNAERFYGCRGTPSDTIGASVSVVPAAVYLPDSISPALYTLGRYGVSVPSLYD